MGIATLLLKGHLAITLPIVAIMAAGFLTANTSGPGHLFAQGVALFGALAIAWLYWAWQAPRWRLWALRRLSGGSGSKLLAMAFLTGLLWPEGSFLERGELRGSDYPRRLLFAKLTAALRRLATELRELDRDDRGSETYTRLLSYTNDLIPVAVRGIDQPRQPIPMSPVQELGAELALAERNDTMREGTIGADESETITCLLDELSSGTPA